MKRALSIVLVGLPLISFVGCSSTTDNPVVVPSGGNSSSGSAGVANSTAGTQPNTGGTSGAGPVAGSPSTGGSEISGGSGGTGTGGVTVGGSGGSGGSAGGSGGSGGSSAGTGGAAGGSSAVTIDGLDGFLIQTPCAVTASDDCDGGGFIYKGATHGCTQNPHALDTDAAATKALFDFPVGGVAGTVYVATMHFYGIMEPKFYGNGVTRESGATRPGMANPSDPAPFASAAGGVTYPASDYNTYEVHVSDNTGKEVKEYFINSDTMQGHYTFAVSYERPIEVIGGGKIHIRVYDQNCRMIKNCGGGGAPCAAKARSVDVSAASPAVTLAQPALGVDAEDAGQWFAIDVKSIVAK
jgi:hypothetical protein